VEQKSNKVFVTILVSR